MIVTAKPYWIVLRQRVYRLFSRIMGYLVPILVMAATAQAAQRVPQPRIPFSSGAYLAGLVANNGRDTLATARYFQEALQADPNNLILMEQAFVSELVNGISEDGFALARKALGVQPKNPLIRVTLAVQACQKGQFARAREQFTLAATTIPGGDFSLKLLSAWAMVGEKRPEEGLRALEKAVPKELASFGAFHMGLMAGVANNLTKSEALLAQAYRVDFANLRVSDAYARVLGHLRRFDEARAVIARWQQLNPGAPYLDAVANHIAKEEAPALLLSHAGEGIAETFYGLSALGASSREGALALIYMQFAHFLNPGDEILTLSLAEFFEQAQQHDRVVALYDRIAPASTLGARAAVGKATALERQAKTEEAIATLRAALVAHPADLDAADTLGALLRLKKRWAESVAVYDHALARLSQLDQRHWILLFGRAVGRERLKQWDKAEPDFKAALALLPPKSANARERIERAQVLNYLAYSWVDMHLNVEQAFEMLREAVALSPRDGAIVDSLGWAHFRLGQFEEAMRELERAVLLKAGDPTINDHLGDAYWRLGREQEARYKWSQALGLSPEPEDAEIIRKKLEQGLPAMIRETKAATPSAPGGAPITAPALEGGKAP